MPLAACPGRLIAADPRAKFGAREISITAEAISIDRCVGGVRMRLRAPTRAFRGVALALLEGELGWVYRVALIHADPELDIVLAESSGERDIAQAWRDWAGFFGLPRYVRGADRELLVERPLGALRAGRPQPRLRGWPLKPRRSPKFRRRCPALAPSGQVHRDEREIIAYE